MLIFMGRSTVTETQTTDYREGLRDAADMCDKTRQQIRLACGELTSQEMRTAQAVLGWIQTQIREKANG